NGNLVKLDYILSKKLQRSNESVYPAGKIEQKKRLLTHSTQDAEPDRDYFSDHAILMATFSIDIPAAQQQPVQPMPVAPAALPAPQIVQIQPAQPEILVQPAPAPQIIQVQPTQPQPKPQTQLIVYQPQPQIIPT